MSLDFDGVNDVVTSAATLTLGSSVTVLGWINADAASGTLLVQGAGNFANARLSFGPEATNRLRVATDRVTTDGDWHSGNNSISLSAWRHVGFTFDFSSTANDPIFYVDGVPITATEVSTPSGALDADNDTVRLGDNSGNTSPYNGRFGEVALWKRILSAAEVAAVYVLGPNAVPDYFFYLPWDEGRSQAFGTHGTSFSISGAVAGPNPPARPANRRG